MHLSLNIPYNFTLALAKIRNSQLNMDSKSMFLYAYPSVGSFQYPGDCSRNEECRMINDFVYDFTEALN